MAGALGSRITTAMQDYFVPTAVDTILGSNVLAKNVLTKAKRWRGNQMKRPIQYQKGVAGSSFAGADLFSTTASTTRINLTFDPAFYEINVTIPLTEIWTNQANDQEKVLDLVALEIQTKANQAADEIGTMMYSDGTGNSNKDFLGFEALVDDATNVVTYGGQSRNTYTTLKSTVTASGGTLTLAKMATLSSDVNAGSIQWTDSYTTETVFNLYEQLLLPQERIVKTMEDMKGGTTLGTGATTLVYKGKPIYADEKCTSGVLYFVNMNFTDFYAMPIKLGAQPVRYKGQIEGNDYGSGVMGLGFHWSDFIFSNNSAVITAHIYLGGEFIGWNPKRSGKLTGVTSA